MGNKNIYTGQTVSKNFIAHRKITTLNEFWKAINSNVSIFARNRPYPTAFFFSWQIKLIKQWIDNGWFWTIRSIKK